MAANEGDNVNNAEQISSVEPKNQMADSVPSKSLLSVLSAMQENMTTSNNMLRELVHERKRKIVHSRESACSSKTRKLDSNRSISAVASEKANTSTSHEVHDSASDEANDSASEKANDNIPDEDVLSLFGDDSLNEVDDETEETNNDELLTQINASLSSSEETGPPVSEKLSTLANEKFQTEYSVEKRKEILQKYKVPSNCEQLFVPKVNPEIWGKLSSNSKRSDIRMSVLQDTLVKVSSAIIVSVNDLLSHRHKKTCPDYKVLVPWLTDSVALIGHVHKERSFKRRDAIRPYLNQDFKQACSRTLKPGKLLFGEDLSKTMQEVKATSKIMTNLTVDNNNLTSKGNSTSKKRFNGFARRTNQFRGTQGRSFLGNRGGNAFPPRTNQYHQRPQQQKKFTKN